MGAGGIERMELRVFSNISYTDYVINWGGECCFNFKTENPIQFQSTILSAGTVASKALTIS